MRNLAFLLLFPLLACGTEEEPTDTGGSDTTDTGGGDAGCVDGETDTLDCNTCTCQDGEWMCTTMGCPDIVEDVIPDGAECADGDTRMEDCNTCECLDGHWACTEMACPDVDDVDTGDIGDDTNDATLSCIEACGDGCPAPEFQLCATDGQFYCNQCVLDCYGLEEAASPVECWDGRACGDSDVWYYEFDCNSCTCNGSTFDCTDRDCEAVADCYLECGVGCPAPEFQECGVDGNLYCNLCNMQCSDVEPAEDRSLCGICESPAGLTADWDRFDVPEGCTGEDEFGDSWLETYETVEDARTALGCGTDVPINILFPDEVLVRAVFPENPAGDVFTVQTEDGPNQHIYMSAPPYCGGAAPPNTVIWLVLDNNGGTIEQHTCVAGRCPVGPPAP
jgi:hypothetical protein